MINSNSQDLAPWEISDDEVGPHREAMLAHRDTLRHGVGEAWFGTLSPTKAKCGV